MKNIFNKWINEKILVWVLSSICYPGKQLQFCHFNLNKTQQTHCIQVTLKKKLFIYIEKCQSQNKIHVPHRMSKKKYIQKLVISHIDGDAALPKLGTAVKNYYFYPASIVAISFCCIWNWVKMSNAFTTPHATWNVNL